MRFYKLIDYPVGFHIDEASIAYNAYSLLLTGKDDNGNFLPLYIDIFGDFRLAGYHYLAVIPVILWGVTEFSARFSGALFGSLTIISFYFLGTTLFKERKRAIIASLLLAVAPWSIVFSRATSEGLVSLFFIITGFAFVFNGIRTSKTKDFVLSFVFLFLSFLFYHTTRIFTPLLLGTILIYLCSFSIKNIRQNKKLFVLFVLLSFVSFVLVFFIKGGTGRFSQVNVFGSFETQFQLNKQIQEDTIASSPFYISRFFHNKLTNVLYMFTNNYLDYFSFNYLFTKGGLPLWYSIPRVGLLHIIELPFMLYGIFVLIKSKEKYYKFPILWLLIAPIVPAITIDDIPNTQRSLVMFPALQLVSAFGFAEAIKIRWKSLLYIVSGLLLFLNTTYFLNQYFFNAKTSKPWYRNNGFRDMMSVVKRNYDLYDKIIMTKTHGGTYPHVLFYMKYDPKKYQEEGSQKAKDYGGFGKFIFHPHNCPTTQLDEKIIKDRRILFIEDGECFETNVSTERRIIFINREDGTKAFRIVY